MKWISYSVAIARDPWGPTWKVQKKAYAAYSYWLGVTQLTVIKMQIIGIAEGISKMGESDVRFGLVQYRDHPPQDQSFVTEVHDFTFSHKRMQSYVNTMAAGGGGDAAECT